MCHSTRKQEPPLNIPRAIEGDPTPITEGDGEPPRKKRPWDSEEQKESTMTFKWTRFEAIPEDAQNNWQVPD